MRVVVGLGSVPCVVAVLFEKLGCGKNMSKKS